MRYEELPKEIVSPITGDTLKIQPLNFNIPEDAHLYANPRMGRGEQLVISSQMGNGELEWWCDVATYKSESGESIYISIEG